MINERLRRARITGTSVRLVAIALITVAVLASTALAAARTFIYSAPLASGKLELYYPQGKHGHGISISWYNRCGLFPAEGLSKCRVGGFISRPRTVWRLKEASASTELLGERALPVRAATQAGCISLPIAESD